MHFIITWLLLTQMLHETRAMSRYSYHTFINKHISKMCLVMLYLYIQEKVTHNDNRLIYTRRWNIHLNTGSYFNKYRNIFERKCVFKPNPPSRPKRCDINALILLLCVSFFTLNTTKTKCTVNDEVSIIINLFY